MDISVKKLSEILKIDPNALLEKMIAAGLPQKDIEDPVSTEDKQTLQYTSVHFFDAGSNTSCGYRVRYSCENSNGMYVNRPHGSDGGYNTNTSMSTLLVLEM